MVCGSVFALVEMAVGNTVESIGYYFFVFTNGVVDEVLKLLSCFRVSLLLEKGVSYAVQCALAVDTTVDD